MAVDSDMKGRPTGCGTRTNWGSSFSYLCFYRWMDEFCSRALSDFVWPRNGQRGDTPRSRIWSVRFGEMGCVSKIPSRLTDKSNSRPPVTRLPHTRRGEWVDRRCRHREASWYKRLTLLGFQAITRPSAHFSPSLILCTDPYTVYFNLFGVMLLAKYPRCPIVIHPLRFALNASSDALTD